MLRRPPRSTRTDTLFPYTTLFRSGYECAWHVAVGRAHGQLSIPAGQGRGVPRGLLRSEEHTSELQSLMRISYAVFCLKKKNITKKQPTHILYIPNMNNFCSYIITIYTVKSSQSHNIQQHITY